MHWNDSKCLLLLHPKSDMSLVYIELSSQTILNQLSLFSHTLRQANFQTLLGHCKNIITKPLKTLPSFFHEVCIKQFIRMFSPVMPTVQLTIPSWIPSLEKSSAPFTVDPQPYQKVKNVIIKLTIWLWSIGLRMTWGLVLARSRTITRELTIWLRDSYQQLLRKNFAQKLQNGKFKASWNYRRILWSKRDWWWRISALARDKQAKELTFSLRAVKLQLWGSDREWVLGRISLEEVDIPQLLQVFNCLTP